MFGLFDQRTIEYFGSRHAALGLVLFWLGLPALIGGTFLFFDVDEIPRAASAAVAIWGAIALSLGIPMRRHEPPAVLYRFAQLWAIVPCALATLSIFAKWTS
ncbi:hypothetical protein [Aurantiacibacter zhengii]|uniref:Uncharacterized protein n=1 Tax=Aurantiacibacter zhengii TaxID=2307003 RepID=A0A418NW71_9SPHN|nr:hypothetical protein [Aurantiacibacter zhengii]RIV88874.1 hypothetical protein D2V07_00920 [Aurantiacibacter zhengii]